MIGWVKDALAHREQQHDLVTATLVPPLASLSTEPNSV